jgi:flagellar hook assembly protein FlgD
MFMNKKYLLLTMVLALLLLSICLIFARQIILPTGVYVENYRNTNGTLSFTIRTVSYGGEYAPRNVGAIWITNATSNLFVKSIKVWASEHRSALVKWMASSGNNTTGAITSATITSHQLHTVSWNGTNVSNAQVADGDYKVNVEFAEHSGTTSNPGKYKYLTFTKGPSAVDQTPANETYFTNMHLTWTPATPANGTISGIVKDPQNNPINGAVITVGTQTATTTATGIYSLSIAPGTYMVSCSALNCPMQTQNNVVVTSNQTTYVNFTLNPVANDDNFLNTPRVLLKQNYPNPFRNSTNISYYVKSNSHVELNIYNAKGQLIKSLTDKTQLTGWHDVSWNSIMDNGKKAVSGKYIVRLSTGDKVISKTITLSD